MKANPRDEIAETLFERHAEIRYVLAHPVTELVLSSAQIERLELLLEEMSEIASALNPSISKDFHCLAAQKRHHLSTCPYTLNTLNTLNTPCHPLN